LNDLIDGILHLVNDDVLSISVALELCKYGADVQTDIYRKHLSGDPDYMYRDWCKLTAKEFISRLESNYCADLSRYYFDKSGCSACPLNTNAYTLFPENEGKCTEMFCLQKKNTQYPVDIFKQTIQDNPAIEITQSPYHSNGNGEVFAELTEQGYSFNECSIRSLPKAPEMPERDRFEAQDEYVSAIEEYEAVFADYETANSEIETLILTGKAKMMLTVNNNEVIKGYAILPENETQTTASDSDTVQKLEKQDRRNREIAVENIVDDTKKLIRETEIPPSDFTEFEERMLYFVMPDDLKRELAFRVLYSESKFPVLIGPTEKTAADVSTAIKAGKSRFKKIFIAIFPFHKKFLTLHS
jgi:ParB family chromosome partitioning protein